LSRANLTTSPERSPDSTIRQTFQPAYIPHPQSLLMKTTSFPTPTRHHPSRRVEQHAEECRSHGSWQGAYWQRKTRGSDCSLRQKPSRIPPMHGYCIPPPGIGR
jgi:hypothetical protein